MSDARRLLPAILALHDRIRSSVIDAFESQHRDDLAGVAHDDEGDTIYAVDRVSEAALVEGLTAIAREEPLVLVAEGLPSGGVPLPEGTRDEDCRWRLLVDPIDGTRGLMYQKRPAWIWRGSSRRSSRLARKCAKETCSSASTMPICRQSSSKPVLR